MKQIKLTQGRFSLIDDEDFEKVSKYKWNVSFNKRNNSFRPSTTIILNNKKYTLLLSRFIMNCPKGMVVDHINHNTLDNRRCNLRICTFKENIYNLKLRKSSKYGYKGISFKKNRWIVQLKKDKKYIYGGSFKDKIEAAKTYDEKAKELFGKYANLNFR